MGTILSSLVTIMIWLSLITGAALTCIGLGHMEWPKVLPFDSKKALFEYLMFIFISFLVILIGMKYSRKSPIVVGLLLCILLAILGGAFFPLIVTLWFSVASVLLGKIINSSIQMNDCDDNWAQNFLVGAGTYGTAIGLLAHFPVNYPGLYGVALVLPLIIEWRLCKKMLVSSQKWFFENCSPERNIKWLEIGIVVTASIHFVIALMPEFVHDALAMHLFIPGHLALRHQWAFDASNYSFAVMPMLGDWIFALGYLLAGETASRLFNVGFIFFLGWLVREYVIWAGGTSLGARWAVLIFFSTPLTFTLSSSLFIESIWSSFIAAGILCILRITFQDERSKTELITGGLMLGFAVAAKSVTFMILPVLVLLLIYKVRTLISKSQIGSVAIGLSLFTLVGVIPYLTAWHLTSNPVFPFYNELFKSTYFPVENFNNARFNSGVSWDLLYQITFNSGKYLESTAGAAGFQWLLLFMPITIVVFFSNNYKSMAILAVGIFSFFMTFSFQSYLRYIYPQLALFAVLISTFETSFLNKKRKLAKVFTCFAIFAVFLNLLFFPSGTWAYRDFYFESIFSESYRKDYLTKHAPVRRAVETVNALNVHRLPVAVFGEPLMAGLSSDALYVNWYNYSWKDKISKVKNEQDLGKLFQEKGIDFFIIDLSKPLISKEQCVLFEQAAVKIAQFESIGVYRLQNKYRFQKEVLENPGLDGKTGWTLVSNAVYDDISKIMIVNVSGPAIQNVNVTGGSRYLNKIVARRHKEATEGRVQVNWKDADGNFIDANIQVFECTSDWKEYDMVVTAPKNAVVAEIYASGHTAIPMEVKSVSFKE
ncbi:phospholipid carrier-dependent glycosyltransferase [Heliophilum fasciatum]|uniref:Dolichyl-phosphate-mannose-protein mannosyltransferase n=1 Tax=Heliophilum fasciatum TaxID=35700 RepID=A0A4R2RN13_9FIRM|nr:phospholipid carrier-dependent glycosyltransferase [Heliophilum fasciatum]MCW2278990.1 hypothetical protein [Heliophilum fasciatum]TCP64059.1 dolichyl-phosphate-mannose-protein mannosyltransferase [Heliophilum fasciatum]